MSGWRIALRNLRRNRRRNLATIAAVALGYAGMVLFGGYIARIEAFIRTTTVYLQHTAHVSVYRRGGLEKSLARPAAHSLSAHEQRLIFDVARSDRRVAFATPYLRGMGLAGNGCRSVPFLATGVEPRAYRRMLNNPNVVRLTAEFARPSRGRALPDAADVPGAVGLSEGLARLLGKPKVHDEVKDVPIAALPACGTPEATREIAGDANIQLAGMTFDGSLSAIDAEVVNHFQATSADENDQSLLTTLGTLQQLFETDAATYVGLFLNRESDAAAVAHDVRTRLAAGGLEVDVYPFTDARVNPYYAGSVAFLGSLLVFVGTLVTAVIVLGIVNSVTLTVYERTREIGTFRALGWRRRQVAGLFLREALLVAGLGIGIGSVLAVTVSTVVNTLNIRFSPPGIPGQVQLVLWPGPLIYLAVAALLVPLLALATWIVARRRTRERTADLLTATAA